jgi:MFS family permease
LLSLIPLVLARDGGVAREAGPPRRLGEWITGLRPGLILVCALTLLGDGLSGAVASEFLIGAAGWSLEQLANQLGPMQAAAELLGFALAAVLVDRVGPARAIAGGAALLGVTWAVLGLVPALWPVHEVYFGVVVVESLGRAGVLVGAYALCMAGVDAKVRATHFLAYMALINLGPVIGAKLAPKVFALASFPGVWLGAAGLQVALVVVALLVARRPDPD